MISNEKGREERDGNKAITRGILEGKKKRKKRKMKARERRMKGAEASDWRREREEERNSPRTESIGNKPIATCTEVRVQIPLVRSDTRDPRVKKGKKKREGGEQEEPPLSFVPSKHSPPQPSPEQQPLSFLRGESTWRKFHRESAKRNHRRCVHRRRRRNLCRVSAALLIERRNRVESDRNRFATRIYGIVSFIDIDDSAAFHTRSRLSRQPSHSVGVIFFSFFFFFRIVSVNSRLN